MDFSVIIPAYNCESSIANTVKSICDVQINEMEIIIVDDGSNDNTGNECKSLISQYSFIKYYYQENQGVSVARNYGISKAVGDYILLWDSDDKADSELLKKCMLTAQKKNADMLIFGMSFRQVYKGKVLHIEDKQCSKEEMIIQRDFPSVLADLFDVNYLSSGCNKILKGELCNQGAFKSSKKSFEDLLYVLELLNFCNSIYIMPDLAYIYEIDYLSNHTSRLKYIDDFSEYILDFQNAVLRLEDTLGVKLPQLRSKIGLIYEWMLSDKLQASSYKELKQLDKDKMKLVLFGKEYVSSSKNSKLFFDDKLIALRLYSIYRNIRHKTSLRIRCIKCRLANF